MMKRWLGLGFMVVCLLLCCGAAGADTLTGTCGGSAVWSYEDGVLTVSGSGAIDDFTSEGQPWAAVRDEVQTVTVEEGITSVGSYAFFDMDSLTSVTLPDGLRSIGERAVSWNWALTSVRLPASVTSIGAYAFFGDLALPAITLPEGLTGLGECAFASCNKLGSVTVPGGVTAIPAGCFIDCGNMTELTVGSGVKTVGEQAFEDCGRLASVSLPASVKTVGENAFLDCDALAAVTYAGTKAGARAIGFAAGNSAIVCASWSCSDGNVTGLTTQSGTCGTDARWSYFGGTLFISGSGAMSSYTENGQPWTNLSSQVTAVVVEKGITSIGGYAFHNMKNLTSVSLPEGLKSIGAYALYSCDSLTGLTVPEGVTAIGERALGWNWSLKTVDLPDSVTSIGAYAFYGDNALTDMTLPASLTKLGEYAFMGCVDLALTAVPAGVTSIPAHCFEGCSAIKALSLPGVKTVSERAFNNCSGMTELTVSAALTAVAQDAFVGCSALKTVNYGGTKSGARAISFGSGNSCILTASWVCSDGTLSGLATKSGTCGKKAKWSFLNGTLTVTGSGAMYDYTEGKQPWNSISSSVERVVVEKGITSIGNYAFYRMGSLTGVSLPTGLKTIGSYAFMSTGLTQLVVPTGVTAIGDWAFNWIWNLKYVELPETLTTIGAYAFRCSFFGGEIVLPASLKTVKTGAFEGVSLDKVSYAGTKAQWAKVSVASGNDKLKDAEWEYGWGKWRSSVLTLPADLTAVPAYAFRGCAAGVVTVNEGCASIGSYAFAQSANLHRVYIPATVTSIASNAFYGCEDLEIWADEDSYAWTWAGQHSLTVRQR